MTVARRVTRKDPEYTLTVRVPIQLYNDFMDICDNENSSKSDIMREAINLLIKDRKEKYSGEPKV